MLKRFAFVISIFGLIYYGASRFGLGLNTDLMIYALVSYTLYEVFGLKDVLSRFRAIFLSITTFFVLKLLMGLPIPVRLEIPEFELFVFLIALALAWMRIGRFQRILTSIGLILSAYFGYSLISKLHFKGAEELGILLAIVLVLLAITTVLPMHRRFESLIDWRAFLITTAIVVFVYSSFIRPLLIGRPGLINVFDWLIVFGVFLKALTKIRMEVVEEETIKQHRRKAEIKVEEIVGMVEKAKEVFVWYGDKALLVTVLAKYLNDAGLKVNEIADILDPILMHEDRRIPKLTFKWEKEWIAKKNRERREEVVRTALERIKELSASKTA